APAPEQPCVQPTQAPVPEQPAEPVPEQPAAPAPEQPCVQPTQAPEPEQPCAQPTQAPVPVPEQPVPEQPVPEQPAPAPAPVQPQPQPSGCVGGAPSGASFNYVSNQNSNIAASNYREDTLYVNHKSANSVNASTNTNIRLNSNA
ncbi:hypothetical protein H4R24_004262, partial [Coemansia sp. RSA 988]